MTNEPSVDTMTSEDLQNDEPRQLSQTVDIQSPTACQRHVTVTVSREDIDHYFNEAVGEMVGEVSVPGFRQGRAPRKLIESQYRKEINDKIKGALLMDSMTQITEGDEFSAISEPEFGFDAVEIPEEGPLTYEFDIEVRPEFDMPKWKGLTLERPNKEFKKKDIDLHLGKLLERHSMVEPVSEPAEANDVLIINVTFKHDGNTVAKLKEEEVRLMPELSFRDGSIQKFDELMIGAKAGDKKSTTMKLSDQVENEELKEQDIDVEIELLDVKRVALPELTDELLGKLGEFESEGDLRDAVKEDLERQLAYHQNQKIREQITGLLTESADWELPPDLLKRQANRELQRAIMELRSSGFDDDQIRAHVNFLRQNSEASTARALKEHFILERIAEDEQLEATDEDYDREIMMMAYQRRESPRSVRARIDKQGLMDALRNQIVENMAIERITEEAKFKDTKFTSPSGDISAVDFAVGGSRAELPEAKHGGDATELKPKADRS